MQLNVPTRTNPEVNNGENKFMQKINKSGKMGGSGALWTIAIVAIAALLVFVYGQFSQTAVGDGTVGTDVPADTVTSQLYGKAATLSLSARDKGADDTTTRRSVPFYVLSPSGTYLATGGSSTSTSGAATFTSGVSVATKPYKVTAFNATYGSINGLQDVLITNEAPLADIPIYTISTSETLTMYDDNDLALSTVQANATVGAGETYRFSKLRIKNPNANTAFRVNGLYWDLDIGTNISSISINDNNVDALGTLPLNSVTSDDLTWKLKAPKLLYEFDFMDINSIAAQADGDNPNEAWTLYVADGEYYYSSRDKGVVFGSETDATSPADVGAANPSLNGRFN